SPVSLFTRKISISSKASASVASIVVASLLQRGPKAALQLRTDRSNLHPGHHDKFAAKHFPRLVIVRQFRHYPAILAILVPAETPVRNRLWTQKLETA